jgi:hypothetical protein
MVSIAGQLPATPKKIRRKLFKIKDLIDPAVMFAARVPILNDPSHGLERRL